MRLVIRKSRLLFTGARPGARLVLVKAARHEPAGQHEVNAETGKTIHGGQFAPGTRIVHVETLGKWSAAKRVNTVRGPRDLRTAAPDENFWKLWREHKDAIKDAGVSVGKDMRGAWQIQWWRDPEAAPEVQKQREEAQKASRATATRANVRIPAPEGKAYFPFQKAGIKYGRDRDNVLIADEMGLGKTIQAIGIANCDPKAKKILVVCPASLKINWQREFEAWDTKNLSVGIAGDTMPRTDVVVINYDILKKHQAAIDATKWDMLICDEAHYLKNETAQRTALVLGGDGGGGIKARRRVFLTGTPIINRPAELWTLVHALDPEGLGAHRFNFMRRYADARQVMVRGRPVWDFSGASNLDELQDRLRSSFMVRRLKQDVLKELPAKTRQIIVLPIKDAAVQRDMEEEAATIQEASDEADALRAVAQEAKKAGQKQVYEHAVKALAATSKVAFEKVAKQRHALAMAKVPAVVSHVNELLDHTDKVIVFAHHLDVIDKLMEGFAGHGAVKVTGEMKLADRQKSVDAFQGSPGCRVFVGNIKAAGVGLTLTAASTVVFAELDWSPGNMQQAEDRAHRIGQTENVLIQHLVFDGSFDVHMANTLVSKQAVIDAAMDTETARKKKAPVSEELMLPPAAPGAGNAAGRHLPDAPTYTPEQRAMLVAALRHLSSLDDDRAAEKNGVGFTGTDTNFGNALAAEGDLTPRQAYYAAKILRKYARTQVGHIISFDEKGMPVPPTDTPRRPQPRRRVVKKSYLIRKSHVRGHYRTEEGGKKVYVRDYDDKRMRAPAERGGMAIDQWDENEPETEDAGQVISLKASAVEALWQLEVNSVYAYGALSTIVGREMLQNATDAVRKVFGQEPGGKVDIVADLHSATMTCTDNGTGMNFDVLTNKFLDLGGTTKGSGDRGGLGVAKAVILGSSGDPMSGVRPDWKIETNNLVLRSDQLDTVKLTPRKLAAENPREGTRITVKGIRRFDYTNNELRALMRTSDVGPIELSINHDEVQPLGGKSSKMPSWSGSWGDHVTAKVTCVKEPDNFPGRHVVVRLDGLSQFTTQISGDKNELYIVDIKSTARPGTPEYPFTRGRDALRGAAGDRLSALISHLNQETLSAGREMKENITWHRNGFATGDPDARVAWDQQYAQSGYREANNALFTEAMAAASRDLRAALDVGEDSEMTDVHVLVRCNRANHEQPVTRDLVNAARTLAMWSLVCGDVGAIRGHLIDGDTTYHGLVYDNDVKALASTTNDGGDAVFINPDAVERLFQKCRDDLRERSALSHDVFRRKAQDRNAARVAQLFFNLACHEIAHIPIMRMGHNETFSSRREQIAENSGHLMPKFVQAARALWPKMCGEPEPAYDAQFAAVDGSISTTDAAAMQRVDFARNVANVIKGVEFGFPVIAYDEHSDPKTWLYGMLKNNSRIDLQRFYTMSPDAFKKHMMAVNGGEFAERISRLKAPEIKTGGRRNAKSGE